MLYKYYGYVDSVLCNMIKSMTWGRIFYSGHKSKSDVLVVVFVVWVLVLGWLGCFT